MPKVLCDECAALCCRYFALEIDPPENVRDYDNIRWYLMHESVVVFIEEGHWYLGILTRCKNLRDDNLCGIYETRPRICRSYTTDNCDYHGAEYNYDVLFTSAEQLRLYAEEQLGRPLVLQAKKPKPKLSRHKDGRKKVKLPVLLAAQSTPPAVPSVVSISTPPTSPLATGMAAVTPNAPSAPRVLSARLTGARRTKGSR